MPNTLQRLSDRLYESLLQPAQWADALDAVRKDLDGAAFHLMQVRKSDQQVMSSLTNAEAPPKKQQEYGEQWVHLDPRMGLAMQTPFGDVMCDHDHLSKTEMDHHPVYTEFLMPIGYRHSLAIPVYDDGHTREILALIGHYDHGPFGVPHRVLAEQLTPDLQRVARLRTRLSPFTQEIATAQTAWQALQSLPHAVILVDAQCRIRYANPAAERLLHSDTATPTVKKSADGPEATPWLLRSRHGQLECNSHPAQQALQALVRGACAEGVAVPAGSQIGSFLLDPPAPGGRQRTVVNVLPQHEGLGLGPTGRKPLALVLITAPHLPGNASPLTEQTLGAALNLTPAEARVALGLADGRTVKELAAQQEISWHTTRTHIKNILRKTSLHRQTELVQLLKGFLAAG